MSKYGIATVFKHSEPGYEFTPNNIPLHLTHVDSFELDQNAEQLAEKLSSALADQKSFHVKALADAQYGPDKNKLVTELELTPSLSKFHAMIMDLLSLEGAVLKNPQFHGEGYCPHISVYGTRRIAIGELITISQVSIASKVSNTEDANTKILATINFKV